MLAVAFLNAHNLYRVGQNPSRGPASQAALDRQIADLGSTIRGAIGGGPPHVVGLCEIGDLDLAKAVAKAAAPGRYEVLWSGNPPLNPLSGAETAVVVLYDSTVVCRTAAGIEQGPSNVAWRTKWMAVEFALAADNAKSFWFVVNHWKSRLGGRRETEPSRMSSAREIGSFYLNTARQSSPAMVLVGDFNAEPGEWPFQMQAEGPGRPNQLMAVRERPLVLRDKLKLAWFYNPMWRWLAEPELWDQAAAEQPRSRPIGSHCQDPAKDAGWALLNQVMANRWAMESKPLRLIEGSVRLVAPVNLCSDHWAVAAQFDH